MAADLMGAASRIFSKQHTESLCSSYLAFSSSSFLEFKLCNILVVLDTPTA